MKFREYLKESKKEIISNLIRDEMSGTNKKTTKDILFNVIKLQVDKLSKKIFFQVFDSLVVDGYLVKTKDNKYVWEI